MASKGAMDLFVQGENMKIKGRSFDAPSDVTITVNVGEDVVFLKAKAVLDYDEFTKLVPMPEPPEVIKAGGQRIKNTESPKYKEAMTKWSLQRTQYMILKSLEATEDLEWDTVKLDDPETWANLESELNKAFTIYGAFRVMQGVMRANGLDEKMLDEARDSFLASARAQQ
jgi:hypothetical protein